MSLKTPLRVGLFRLFVVLASLGLLACGDESDENPASEASGLAGVYATTSHQQSQPCSEPLAPAALEPPYLQIVDDESFIDVNPCTSADPSTCDDSSPLVFLAEPIGDNTYRAQEATKSGTADSCYVEWIGDTVRVSGNELMIGEERHSGDWTGAACDGELTDAQVAQASLLPCDVADLWTGTKQ